MKPDWTNGNIDLYCADARIVLAQLDAKVDSVITDPPYGISLKPLRGVTKSIANDKRNEAKALFYGILPDLDRLTAPDSSHLIFGGWSERWVADAIDEWWKVKSCIVWRKHVLGLGYYTRSQHEFIWYAHKGKPPVPETAQSDVWDFKRELRPQHSCQKPIDLIAHCIDFTTKPGDLVLDPFMGSGTTVLAAMQTGRRCIAIESDPQHFELAVSRLGLFAA